MAATIDLVLRGLKDLWQCSSCGASILYLNEPHKPDCLVTLLAECEKVEADAAGEKAP
jgi:hypothetical protein